MTNDLDPPPPSSLLIDWIDYWLPGLRSFAIRLFSKYGYRAVPYRISISLFSVLFHYSWHRSVSERNQYKETYPKF